MLKNKKYIDFELLQYCIHIQYLGFTKKMSTTPSVISYRLEGFTRHVASSHATAALVVAIVASFAAMVSSAYCANHIKNSAAYKTADESLKKAYSFATWSSVISALLTVGAVGGILWIGFMTK